MLSVMMMENECMSVIVLVCSKTDLWLVVRELVTLLVFLMVVWLVRWLMVELLAAMMMVAWLEKVKEM
jgi:hypothetical protein